MAWRRFQQKILTIHFLAYRADHKERYLLDGKRVVR